MCAIYECFNLFAYLDWTEVMQSCHSLYFAHWILHFFLNSSRFNGAGWFPVNLLCHNFSQGFTLSLKTTDETADELFRL